MKRIKLFDKAIKFLKEVRSELRKVVWPNRQQVLSSTVVVIAMVLLVGVFVAVVDFVLGFIARQLGF